MLKQLQVTNEKNLTINVVYVPAGHVAQLSSVGDPYSAKTDIIVFYDARFNFTEFGQHISHYNVDTIQQCRSGIDLDGGVPEWEVSLENVRSIQQWLDA